MRFYECSLWRAFINSLTLKKNLNKKKMNELESIDKSMSEIFRQHDYRAMYYFYNNYIRVKLLQALQQREKLITLEEVEYRIKEEYKKHKELDWAKIAASKIYSVIEQQRESDNELIKVKAVTDESSHWYVIPNELAKEFYQDEEDETMIDSGKFDDKWSKYRTGGDLNLVQLYAKI